MDWKDAVEEVAKVAPAVATAIGGPTAGGITASAARMVTEWLGVENTPAGLVAATQDQEKRAELIRINNEHRRAMEQMRIDAEAAHAAEVTARLTETQRTMRAELADDGWFKSGWRPCMGYVFMLSMGGLVGVLAYSLVQDPTLAGDPEFAGLLVWALGSMAAALGINVRQRTVGKALERGQQPSSFMDAVKTRVAGK